MLPVDARNATGRWVADANIQASNADETDQFGMKLAMALG